MQTTSSRLTLGATETQKTPACLETPSRTNAGSKAAMASTVQGTAAETLCRPARCCPYIHTVVLLDR